MTRRQKALGVTEHGYQRGIEEKEFLADYEAFLAKASTIKKGQHVGIEITRQWFPEFAGCDSFITAKHEQVKRYFVALTVNNPDNFLYTDTYGLDCLTVK